MPTTAAETLALVQGFMGSIGLTAPVQAFIVGSLAISFYSYLRSR